MKLSEWLDIWLNKYLKYCVKQRTFYNYNMIVKNHIAPILGQYDLKTLTIEILQNYLIEKKENGNLINNKSLSNNTILCIISVLKQSLKQAKINNIIIDDKLFLLKLPKTTINKINAFTLKEQNILQQYCMSHNIIKNFGIILCLYTGIRIGELLALTWDDVDFINNCLFINKTKYSIIENGKSKIIIDSPKTISSIREIPLPKVIIKILKDIKKNTTSKYVVSCNGKGILNRSYQSNFKSILKKCNIQYKNFHCLRHTFATRAIEQGMDIKTLSEILGHKNASITLNVYSHCMKDFKIKQMNKLTILFEKNIQ